MPKKAPNRGSPSKRARQKRQPPSPPVQSPVAPERHAADSAAGVLGELRHALAEAAGIYFAPTPAPPPEAPELGPLQTETSHGLRLEDVAVRLGSGLEKVKELLAGYPQLFAHELPRPGCITETGFLKLAALVRMLRDGLSEDEIRRRMALVSQGGKETAADHEGGDTLRARVEELVRLLERSEDRRLDERDRMLTTLMRTHQEIQHLRYELAAAIPRRERRRRSFWNWILGV